MNLINRLGILKNRILIVVIIGCIVLSIFAVQSEATWLRYLLLTFVCLIIVGTIVFYICASFNLPRTEEELAFLKGSQEVIKIHHGRKKTSQD